MDNTTTTTILGGIDPDVQQRLVSRRAAILKGAAVSSTVMAGLAMASAPIALAALSREAFGQGTSPVQDVLNFALALEIFEKEFYSAVLGVSSSTAQNNAFTAVRTQAAAVPGAVAALTQIQKHETEHVTFLMANGAQNVFNLSADSFDFTGGQGSGTGPFARATTELPFLLLVAQGAEDTGVRAYKGQAPNLQSNPTVLEAALRIHSVEARHASKIRRMRRANGAPSVVKFSGTISGGGAAAAGADNVSNPPAAAVAVLAKIYAGEDNVTQGGVNVSTLPNLPSGAGMAAATEAFDEPLSRADVVTIVQPFFKVTIM